MAEEKQWHIVSDDYLDKLGGWFLKWGQDFYQAHYNSLQMHVTPGATPEGVAFKEEFNKRKEELSTRLDKARDAFTNCGYELKRMSREHYNTVWRPDAVALLNEQALSGNLERVGRL